MAGYSGRCSLAMAYLVVSDAYGKASEKDYNQEGDSASLIAQIVNGDPYANGTKRWTIPFWAKAHPTPIVTPVEPVAPPKRPAHRPAGDREKMLAKIRRYFELRAFESDGKVYYHVDDLAERFGLKRRTMQTYLRDLKVERHQDPGPGGRAC